MTGTLNYTCSTPVGATPSTPPVEIFSNFNPLEAMDSILKATSLVLFQPTNTLSCILFAPYKPTMASIMRRAYSINCQ